MNSEETCRNFAEILRKRDAIREAVHRVGKRDFEIFMAARRGENEEYSEKKKLVSKA